MSADRPILQFLTGFSAMGGTFRPLPDPPATEDTRCALCNRRVATSGPYAVCRRCSDELNSGGGEWSAGR